MLILKAMVGAVLAEAGAEEARHTPYTLQLAADADRHTEGLQGWSCKGKALWALWC